MAQLLGSPWNRWPASAPCSPRNGVERVDDGKVLSGIIPVIQKGLAGWMPLLPMAPTTPLQPLPPLVRQGCF